MVDILVVPVPDRGVAARVLRAVKPYAGFDGDVPAFREHPRIPVADTQTAGMTFMN